MVRKMKRESSAKKLGEKTSKQKFFRREFLTKVATTFAGAGIFASGAMPAVAMQKANKDAVNYQDSPNDSLSCSQCRFFDGNGGCDIVDGAISPDGWCAAFSEK